MTTCALVIPPAGLCQIYLYETDWTTVLDSLGGGPYVRLDLIKDGEVCAGAMLSVGEGQPENTRGQAAIVALVGSWVTVTGPIVLSGLTEKVALDLNQVIT